MSHELEQFDDGSTSFVAGHHQDAWHQLGTVLPAGLTAADVMHQAHPGGWNVRKQPIFTTLLDDTGVTQVEIGSKHVTARTNPITGNQEVIGLSAGHAGVVGDTYTPFQNEQLVDYLQAMTDESGACFDTAGSLRGGANVFITMKLPTTMLVGGIDAVYVNIAVLNNHTGTRAITGLITPTRIVCGNTQRAALGNATATFKVRHTGNAGERVQQAREALGLTWKYVAAFETEAEKMIQQQLAEAEFRTLCDQIWAPPTATAIGRSKTIAANRTRELTRLFVEADTNAAIRGTRWAGYQAITECLDHTAPVHGNTTADKTINRALRSIDGSVVAIKEKAFALLTV